MRVPSRPEILRWDHNAHFHRWVMRRLPTPLDRALDVGCGTGAFARVLATRAEHVDAVDLSSAMIDVARQRPDGQRITWWCGDVSTLDLPPSAYDAVTAIASLHHLPLEAGLERLGSLVRPGGTLAVVGLARLGSWRDLLLGAVTFVLDPLVGAATALLRSRRGRDPVPPLRDPEETVEEIAAAARRLLPGARVRRHLFYRCTLLWTAPA